MSTIVDIVLEIVWCNQSGGSAMGSLGEDTAISNIMYNHIYTNGTFPTIILGVLLTIL